MLQTKTFKKMEQSHTHRSKDNNLVVKHKPYKNIF